MEDKCMERHINIEPANGRAVRSRKRSHSPTSVDCTHHQLLKRQRTVTKQQDSIRCLHCSSTQHMWSACKVACMHCYAHHPRRRCPKLDFDRYKPGPFIVLQRFTDVVESTERDDGPLRLVPHEKAGCKPVNPRPGTMLHDGVARKPPDSPMQPPHGKHVTKPSQATPSQGVNLERQVMISRLSKVHEPVEVPPVIRPRVTGANCVKTQDKRRSSPPQPELAPTTQIIRPDRKAALVRCKEIFHEFETRLGGGAPAPTAVMTIGTDGSVNTPPQRLLLPPGARAHSGAQSEYHGASKPSHAGAVTTRRSLIGPPRPASSLSQAPFGMRGSFSTLYPKRDDTTRSPTPTKYMEILRGDGTSRLMTPGAIKQGLKMESSSNAGTNIYGADNMGIWSDLCGHVYQAVRGAEDRSRQMNHGGDKMQVEAQVKAALDNLRPTIMRPRQ